MLGILIGIVFVAIGALIATLILMLAAKVVVKDIPEFADGYKACFSAGLIMLVLNIVAGLVFGGSPTMVLVASLAILAGTFFVYMFMIQKFCGYTIGQSAGITGIMAAIFIVIWVGIGIAAAALATGIGAASGGP